MNATRQTVLDARGIQQIIEQMARDMLDRTRGASRLGLVGIQRGGSPIARRLASQIASIGGGSVPVGDLDITLYRDDAASTLPDPKVGPSRIEWEVADADVVLVDDVLQTGRTVRAAIDCLFDYGRPRRIWLAVMCDRGGRQLPMAADFVGRTLEVPAGLVLEVVAEGGAADGAWLRTWSVSSGGGT